MRGREKHLHQFIASFLQSMQHHKIDVKVFVVEQSDTQLWNKGLLFNVGFLQAAKRKLAYNDGNWLFSDGT